MMQNTTKEHGGRWLNLNVKMIQRYVDQGHSRIETENHFKVSAPTLRRHGIVFSGKQRLSKQLQKGIQAAAALTARGVSLNEAAAQTGMNRQTLRRHQVATQHSVGWPSVDRKRLVIFTWLVTKHKISQRKAEGIAGVNRLTWRSHRKKKLEALNLS